jgi:UDP-N-acetylglucosamine diphosphorylase / glucose-1-phosphate thymidylyltransferase / UDP-N-acetylgalactosamine diphosphorylase / glucosamine-1-phosphate N-acetyltransferase / galactosamine-1-phosphate N-acetyltransferase
MQSIVFEDDAVAALGPLVAARPASDLTIGTGTLVESLGRFGPVRRAPRTHLRDYLTALAGTRVPLWGGAADATVPVTPASRHGDLVLLVNARLVPERGTLAALRSLVERGRRGLAMAGDTIAAAILHMSPDGAGPDRRLVDDLLAGTASPDALATLGLEIGADTGPLALLARPHDVIDAHERVLPTAVESLVASGRFIERQPGLFAAESARVTGPVVVRQGPVVIDDGADIGPFVCCDGPVYVGREARVNPHAWLRAGTSIGAHCRVGGEVEASVMEPFSNKPHDGFLGHSHVGSWVNLAAGTITSNLKVSYGIVRQRGGGVTIDTGRQFLGAILGDLAKTAINTSLPCGAVVGVAATVAGDLGGLTDVPAFTNQLIGGPGGSTTSAEQAATTLERMMARRGLAIHEADVRLLAAVAAAPAR